MAAKYADQATHRLAAHREARTQCLSARTRTRVEAVVVEEAVETQDAEAGDEAATECGSRSAAESTAPSVTPPLRNQPRSRAEHSRSLLRADPPNNLRRSSRGGPAVISDDSSVASCGTASAFAPHRGHEWLWRARTTRLSVAWSRSMATGAARHREV